MDEIGLRIMNTDAYVTSVKYLVDLVADSFVDALDVELGSKGFLDAVDDRQLGIALFRLLQQVLALLLKARGSCYAPGKRIQALFPDAAAGQDRPVCFLDRSWTLFIRQP